MTLLNVGLTCPLHHIWTIVMKIIDKNMKCEFSILFAQGSKNHQKKAKNSVFWPFLGLLTLRGYYRPQKHGKWMKILRKNCNNLKKHQKNFEQICSKNESVRGFQSENLSNFTRFLVSPQPYGGFQCPLHGR